MTPEQEIRMRCVEQATPMAARLNHHEAKTVIDIAKELEYYVRIGSSPTDSASGDADSQESKIPRSVSTSKRATVKSG